MNRKKPARASTQPSANRRQAATAKKKKAFRNIDALDWRILSKYPGKHIIYSEDEQRVIGVGDTDEEAFAQAKASGVGGLWHSAYADPPGVENI